MVRVAALTSGRNVPSARFRVRQHLEPLRVAGVEVREHVPLIDKYAAPPVFPGGAGTPLGRAVWRTWAGVKLLTRVPGLIGAWNAQVLWLDRELLPGHRTLEPWLRRPYVFDVDDAIWLGRPGADRDVSRIAEGAAVVIAGNAYLAKWFAAHARDVRIVPTAVDTDRYLPRHFGDQEAGGRFAIGWTGSKATYRYLYAIEAPLARFVADHDAELVVVADEPPRFQRLPVERVRYIRWSPAVEAEAVRKMDIGLMPLPLDEWTRGKCSLKMLQYMACGVPAVVSPVGMNAEILAMGRVGLPAAADADWYDALRTLYRDRTLALQLGKAGRALVEERFSRAVVSRMLALLFHELA